MNFDTILDVAFEFGSSCMTKPESLCYFQGPYSIKIYHLTSTRNPIVDKTVVRSSYLHNGISYTGKMISLYWIGALLVYLDLIVSNRGKLYYTRHHDSNTDGYCFNALQYIMQFRTVMAAAEQKPDFELIKSRGLFVVGIWGKITSL